MSALGQKQTFAAQNGMSALGQKRTSLRGRPVAVSTAMLTCKQSRRWETFSNQAKMVEEHASGGNDVSHNAHLVADRCSRSGCRRVLCEQCKRFDPGARNRAFHDRRFRSGH